MILSTLSPDIWLILTFVGLFLIVAEFCFPGRVVFAACGGVLLLGGIFRLLANATDGGPHLWVAIPFSVAMASVFFVLLRIAAAGRRNKRDLTRG